MLTEIVCVDGPFPTVMEAVLNYTGAFNLQYGISLAKARTNDIVENMILLLYLSEQSGLSYARYNRLGRLMTKNSNALQLL